MNGMASLLDLPIEIFFGHIFRYLPKEDVIWNIGFVCKQLQAYVVNFVKTIVIERNEQNEQLGLANKKFDNLIHSNYITNSIFHVVNRNNWEWDLVDEVKSMLEQNQIILEIQNFDISTVNDRHLPNFYLIEICKKCPQIQSLISIGTNIPASDISVAVSYLNRLKSLILFGDLLTNADVISIVSQCNELEVLVLHDQFEITDVGINGIAKNCTKIKNLDLHGCFNVTDNAIDILTSNCTQLNSLDLYGCDKLTDLSLNSIAINCRALKEIDVGGCHSITDNGVKILARYCIGLTCFDGSSCYKLTDESVKALALNCQQLEFLAFEFCGNLTNQAMKYVKRCRNLKHLDVNGCPRITKRWQAT